MHADELRPRTSLRFGRILNLFLYEGLAVVVLNTVSLHFKVFVFALGIMVATCVSVGVSRMQHFPVHLARWTGVLHY